MHALFWHLMQTFQVCSSCLTNDWYFFLIFQGLIFAFLLALIGSCFVCPVFVKADLVYSSPVYLDKTLFCEVDFPKEYSYLYTLITSIAHYFATLVIVVVLYTAIICRLKTR